MSTIDCVKDAPLSKTKVRSSIKRMINYFDFWRTFVFVVVICICSPIVALLLSFFQPQPDIWKHIIETQLFELISNTALLAIGVLSLTFILGVSLAWITSVCDYPGRKVFAWLLLLPLAVPTYVMAFVFLGLFDYSGPVQTFLRTLTHDGKLYFPDIRSTTGVIVVMSLAFYPYVYLLARSAFKTQGKRALEAAQSLGLNRFQAFFKIALPMARPWIVGGLMLVFMETLADFGAVSIFNYNTFTTAIYKAWYGLFSLPAAAQLSSILVFIAMVVLVIEQKMRSRMRFSQAGRSNAEAELIYLTGWKRWGAFTFSLIILLAGFIVPVGQLLYWVLEIYSEEINSRYLGFLFNTITFAFTATFIVAVVALLIAYAQRYRKDVLIQVAAKASTMGYALPGTVLAVGIVIVTSGVDNLIHSGFSFFGVEMKPFFQGSFIIVIAAYLVRFMASGFNPIESAMHRITPSLDEAALSMNVKGFELLRRIHIPILKQGLITACLLVFVDVMKEMPITLMTRPFGWDTLAVKIYELTSEGEWKRAALPAITLILSGMIPVFFLSRQSEKS